jgi:hypothetical protein
MLFCVLVVSDALGDVAVKFDEYGDIPFSDEKARLDNLAIQLQNQPTFIAWYVVYGGRRSCIDEARSRAVRAKAYLIKKHGISADRVMWIDGGYREDFEVEIWVWPRSAGAPSAQPDLKRTEIQIVKNCKSKKRAPKRRVKLERAHNNLLQRSAG